jgi:diacylglycerol kinase family enzyme
MRNHILYNPLAGHGKHNDQIEKLKETLEGESVDKDIRLIESYKDFMTSLAPDDRIILCGGDGTINRFVNESGFENYPNEIFYYAMGSGNDFLNDVKASEPIDKPFSLNKYIEDLPVATVKGKDYKFINGIGYGIDGYACQEGERLKALNKAVNYTLIAIKGLLFAYTPTKATVTVDGVSYEYVKVWIAPTMNGRFYGGGIMTVPTQDRLSEDGLSSVMIFHGTSRPRTLMIFPSMFRGQHLKYTKAITVHKGNRITVKFDRPSPLQIDGETVLDVTEYTVHSRAAIKNKEIVK